MRFVGDAAVLPVAIKRDGRHARAERTHQAIVTALLDLADLGNLSPTAREIADRAGVALRSIRQHFDSRESLFLAAAEEHARRVAGASATVDPSGKLAHRISAFARERSSALESTSALRRAATIAEPSSLAITRAMATAGKSRRRELEVVFARELDRMQKQDRKAVLDALDVATCGRAWDALRNEMKLSHEAARAVLELTIGKLLG